MLPLRPLRLVLRDSGEVPVVIIFNEGTVRPVDIAAGEAIETKDGDVAPKSENCMGVSHSLTRS